MHHHLRKLTCLLHYVHVSVTSASRALAFVFSFILGFWDKIHQTAIEPTPASNLLFAKIEPIPLGGRQSRANACDFPTAMLQVPQQLLSCCPTNEPVPTGITSGRYGARRVVPTPEVERRQPVQ